MKAMMPSLREKKRYLAFEIISGNMITDTSLIEKSIMDQASRHLGEIGMADAGIQVLRDSYCPPNQRGIIKVSHNSLNQLRSTLAFIKTVGIEPAAFRSIGASGILKKAQNRYLK